MYIFLYAGEINNPAEFADCSVRQQRMQTT